MNKFIFEYQDKKYGIRQKKGWQKPTLTLSPHTFTSKDWIVRWCTKPDTVFTTKVQKMYSLILRIDI